MGFSFRFDDNIRGFVVNDNLWSSSNLNLGRSNLDRRLIKEGRLNDELWSFIGNSLSVDVGHDDVKVLSVGVLHVNASKALLAIQCSCNISFAFNFGFGFNFSVTFTADLSIKVCIDIDIDIALSK